MAKTEAGYQVYSTGQFAAPSVTNPTLSALDVDEVMSIPVEQASIFSTEEFEAASTGPTLTEFFALYARSIREGKITEYPVEHFAEERAGYRTMVQEMGNIRLSF